MRLKFHLSYPRIQKSWSINANTPKHLCSVKYPEFSDAVRLCLQEMQQNHAESCFIACSDAKATFRNLGVLREQWKVLCMKAKSPVDKKWYFFFDKCLAFESSRSCAIFQAVSDSICFLVTARTGKQNVNYLDNYYFCAFLELICNNQVHTFLAICHKIKFPVALDKTFWASTTMTFLSFLIDTINKIVCIPLDKLSQGKNMIAFVLNKRNRRITVHQLQKICGFLNFLGRAIIPGCAFTRRLYAQLSGNSGTELRLYHHIYVTGEMRMDLQMWFKFLNHQSVFCKPFMDFSNEFSAQQLQFYSDASTMGMGAYCQNSGMFMKWDRKFMKKFQPSIECLEMVVLTAVILAWINRFPNKKVILYSDNQGVQGAVNQSSTHCKNCMALIRLIVLKCLIHNVDITIDYVKSADNDITDSLSRLQWNEFRRLTRKMSMDEFPTPIPEKISNLQEYWVAKLGKCNH